MSSIISYFSKRYRRTRSQACDVDRKGSVLKRRPRFLSADGSRFRDFMRSSTSIHSIPKQSRPHRSSTADIPDLPCLPIYQTFTSKSYVESLRTDVKPDLKFEEDDEAQGPAQSLSPSPSPSRPTADGGSTVAESSGPVYDRAVELARDYRAILPEFDDVASSLSRGPSRQMPSRFTHSRPSLRGAETAGHYYWQPTRASPLPWAASVFSPSLAFSTTAVEHDSGPRSSGVIVASPSPARSAPLIPARNPIRSSNLNSNNDPSAVSMPTLQETLTAAAEPQAQPASPSTSPSRPRSSPPRQEQQLEALEEQQQFDRATAGQSRASSRCCYSALPPSRMGGHAAAGNTISLQICAQLLADELAKAFSPPRRQQQQGRSQSRSADDYRAARLQVLLLIEGYEGVLANCRREMDQMMARLQPRQPPEDGLGGNEDELGERHGRETEDEGAAARDESEHERIAHMRDAVDILEHWLDVLHGVYEEAFGGQELLEDKGDDGQF